jgi:Tfp pilus assembly protein PilX
MCTCSGSRAGFALPAAIFALVVVAVLVTAGFFLAGQESRIGQSTQRATEAFYLAEHGINEVLETWNPAQASLELWESTGTCTVCQGGQGDGEWQVTITRTGERTFFVQSTATITTGGRLAGASRTLGQFTRIITAEIPAESALLTRGDVSVRGRAEVLGEDVNPPGWGGVCSSPGADKPGVLTDTGSTVTTDGADAVVSGDPPWDTTDLSDDDFLQFGDLHWDDLVALAEPSHRLPGGTFNGIQPSTTGSPEVCNTSDPSNWGEPNDPGSLCGSFFPIIHIDGNASIQSGGEVRGQGILLVEGDLDIRGAFEFFGLVMVKGQFESQGSGAGNTQRIRGAVLAGNAELDQSVLTGGATVQYSSCAVTRAMENAAGLTTIRPLRERGWTDLTMAGF